MNSEINIIGESSLQFFGKISASISHEINNVLAIINEHAGLLNDFAMMADKGRSIDPQRLEKIASNILSQIRRAEGIVQNMNRFSHTIDQSKIDIDLQEAVTFMLDLFYRFTSTRSIVINLTASEDMVKITAAPFFLVNLMWLCLDFVMNLTNSTKTINITVQQTGSCGQIRFTGLEGLTEKFLDDFLSDQHTAQLFHILNATLTVSAGGKELNLALPNFL